MNHPTGVGKITILEEGEPLPAKASNPPIARLFIRMIEDANNQSGKAIALCTEDGNVFGTQTACTVTSETECFTTVTATFIVDGKAIRFE